jgi:hypothetical protein
LISYCSEAAFDDLKQPVSVSEKIIIAAGLRELKFVSEILE